MLIAQFVIMFCGRIQLIYMFCNNQDKSDLTADLSRQLEDCQTALGSMKDKSRSSSWPPTTVSPLSFGSDIENMITDEASNFDNSNNEELQIKLKVYYISKKKL